jgi:uncharacterized protein
MSVTPDYIELTRFLLKPFLEHPEAIKFDVEFSEVRQRVLIRVALGEEDTDRAFGRGGRNLTAIRTTIEGIGKAAGHSAHLEIFGVSTGHAAGGTASSSSEGRPPRRSSPSRPVRRS